MSENKVQFGLKNCYYAIATQSGASVVYSTPVAIPGGIKLNANAVGELTKFYADNMVYYTSQGNGGYDGSAEFAKIPDAMLKDVFAFSEGATSKVLTENESGTIKHVALLFQIDGDANNDLHVLYDVLFSRPPIDAATKQGNNTPQTTTINFSATPRADGKVRAKTQEGTPTTTRNSWFTTVFVEA